jgi:ribonuclease HI
MDMPHVKIATDGACKGNPGPGGWGVLLRFGAREKELSGHDPDTTNNRMEILAAIRGLQALTKPCQVTLETDSVYLRDGITKWIFGWQKNGWKTASKQPVKNADLWQELLEAIKPHRIAWRWVKGHAGDPDNERADKLATEAAMGVTKG